MIRNESFILKTKAIKALFRGTPVQHVESILYRKKALWEAKMKSPFSIGKKKDVITSKNDIEKAKIADDKILTAVANFKKLYKKKKTDETYIENKENEGAQNAKAHKFKKT